MAHDQHRPADRLAGRGRLLARQRSKVGNLPPAMLASVLEVLAGFTADPGDCYHAVWEGWGWQHGDRVIGTSFPSDSSDPRRFRPPQPAPPGLPQEVLAGPRLSHPGRDYLLFHGPLRAALSIGHQVTADWRLPQSPSLLWPADKSWLLATEIDFDSTLVGGSTQLVQELLQATPSRPGQWASATTSPSTATGSTSNVPAGIPGAPHADRTAPQPVLDPVWAQAALLAPPGAGKA
jgi:hypothetical protein